MEYLSAKDMAKKWNITERQVQQLCADERIIGIKRIGRTWLVPQDARKPEDLRKSRKKQGGN